MLTVKEAMIELLNTEGAQDLETLTREAFRQASYPKGSNVRDLVQQALNDRRFTRMKLDDQTLTWRYRDFA